MATDTTALPEDTQAMRAARAEIDRLQAAIGRQQALLLQSAVTVARQHKEIVALRAELGRLTQGGVA